LNYPGLLKYYVLYIFIFSTVCLAQQQNIDALPKPAFDGENSPLLALLNIRRTNRIFDSKRITSQGSIGISLDCRDMAYLYCQGRGFVFTI
jgi:hypothetical protein